MQYCSISYRNLALSLPYVRFELMLASSSVTRVPDLDLLDQCCVPLPPEGCFSIKMLSAQYRNAYYRDKMVCPFFILGIPKPGKTVFILKLAPGVSAVAGYPASASCVSASRGAAHLYVLLLQLLSYGWMWETSAVVPILGSILYSLY